MIMFVPGIPHSYFLRSEKNRSVSNVMESPTELSFLEVINYAQATYKLKQLLGRYDLVHKYQDREDVIALIDSTPYYKKDSCYQASSLERINT